MLRVPIRVGITGCRMGWLGSSPRNRRNHSHPLAPDDPVRIDPLFKVGDIGHMAADDNHGRRLVLPDQLAHPFDFQHVGRDAADPHDIVAAVADLLDEAVQGREVEQRAGRCDVGLDEHQPPGAVEHPQRERTFDPRDLVVVQFHRVDDPAAVFVVLGVGAEDTCQ